MPNVENLTGLTLESGWVVGEKIKKPAASTGGFFSIGYEAHHSDGRVGFLKAFDIRNAFDDPSRIAESLNEATSVYLFERNLLNTCKDLNIRNVVISLDANQVGDTDPRNTLFYIIFEMADCDARVQSSKFNRRNYSWSIKALGDIALAIKDLHASDIHHQDLKPSNVLIFDSGDKNKIADFGRSHKRGTDSPHYNFGVAGQISYAPPELLYRGAGTEDATKTGCDLYHFGSLILFLFTGLMATPELMDELDESYRWNVWGGNFADALPYLTDAHMRVCMKLEASLKEEIPANLYKSIGRPILDMFKSSTNPSPLFRGDPRFVRAKHMNSHSLDPFLSKINNISKYISVMDRVIARQA